LQKLRSRLGLDSSHDGGLTLIEVVVAMMIFMVITTGLLYTMTSLLGITRDSRARQVATNLAAQEIDLARSIGDVFNVQLVERTVELNGDRFTVKREAEWDSNAAVTEPCGAGGGTLRFKRVKVTVSWEGKRGSAPDVVSDTLINPRDRISDPELGTILVSVTSANGVGVPNVPVTAKFTTGTSAVLTAKTDAQGCAYLLKVAPTTGTNTYTVSIKSPGADPFVDVTSVPEPSTTTPVIKGTSSSADFTYDRAATLRATFRAPGSIIPNNMSASLISTRDPVSLAGSSAANPRSILVSPWIDGYTVVAGDLLKCQAHDPGRWTAYGVKPNGSRSEAVASGNVTVPMGTVDVNGLGTSRWIIAEAVVSTTAVNGQPSCVTAQTLRFPQLAGAAGQLSLPFGSWTLHKNSSSSFSSSSSNKIAVGNITVGPAGSVSSSAVVTLDPRTD